MARALILGSILLFVIVYLPMPRTCWCIQSTSWLAPKLMLHPILPTCWILLEVVRLPLLMKTWISIISYDISANKTECVPSKRVKSKISNFLKYLLYRFLRTLILAVVSELSVVTSLWLYCNNLCFKYLSKMID